MIEISCSLRIGISDTIQDNIFDLKNIKEILKEYLNLIKKVGQIILPCSIVKVTDYRGLINSKVPFEYIDYLDVIVNTKEYVKEKSIDEILTLAALHFISVIIETPLGEFRTYDDGIGFIFEASSGYILDNSIIENNTYFKVEIDA